jgi:hypothetical protein
MFAGALEADMATWGDYQSLFQLSTALNMGVSGVLSLWEDPQHHHRTEVENIRARALALPLSHPDLAPDLLVDVKKLDETCTADLSEPIAILGVRPEWLLLVSKLVSVVCALMGLRFLTISSNLYDFPLDASGRFWSLMLFVPIGAILVTLAVVSVLAARSLRARRLTLDRKYRDLVVRIWKAVGCE